MATTCIGRAALFSGWCTPAMADAATSLQQRPLSLRATTPPRTGQRLAVFDLDRTLLCGSSLLAFAKALTACGLVSRRRMVTAMAQERRFRRSGLGDVPVGRLRDDALRHVAGLEASSFVDLATEVGLALSEQVLPGAILLLRRHLSAGDYVVILSASPQELVEAVASGLEVHRAIGTKAEERDGRFTGELSGPFCYGVGKVARLTTELGSEALTIASAYADSASDLPLLEASREPVAVNPDRRLHRIATQRNWPVLRFR